MKLKNIRYALLSVLILLINSCASKPLPPPEWAYEKDAVKIQIKADQNLNLYEGEPNTLLICVYQLQDPNEFNQLSGDEPGLFKLLECELFGASATSAKRLIIQPGQQVDMSMDRAEGTRYVAVAAGYDSMVKDRMVKMVEIPVAVEKKGIIKRTKTNKPQPLNIKILLGPRQILSVEGN